MRRYITVRARQKPGVAFDSIESLIVQRLKNCCRVPVVLSCKKSLCEEAFPERPTYQTVSKCYNRICRHPRCIKARQSRTRKVYEPIVLQMRQPRFITLTLRGHYGLSFEPKHRLDSAWKSLSQYLRRHGLMSKYVKATEIVHSDKGYYWHLHVIYEGRYIPQGLLKEKWLAYTKDSFIVYIQRVRDRIVVSDYIRKYITKGSDLITSVKDYLPIRNMQFFSSYGQFDPVTRPVFPKIMCSHCNTRMSYDEGRTVEALNTCSSHSIT